VGQEVACRVEIDGAVSAGRAYLESDRLLFRGDLRLAIPFVEMTSIVASAGQLEIGFSRGVARFELGPRADIWARKIRYPRTLLDKLGLRPDVRVALMGISDESFRRQLGEGGVEADDTPDTADAVFYQADTRDDLDRIAELARVLVADGALWIVAPKGRRAIAEGVTENDVLTAGRAAGLYDVKVVAFSASHTAHKFVIPVARRGQVAGGPRARSGS
jgi:hypothetical protein